MHQNLKNPHKKITKYTKSTKKKKKKFCEFIFNYY